MQNKNKLEALLKVDKVTNSLGVRNSSNLKRNSSTLFYKPIESATLPRVNRIESVKSVIDLSKQANTNINNNHNELVEINRKYLKTAESNYLIPPKIKPRIFEKKNESPLTAKRNEISELKRMQRNQIYALNELMTRLEYENFLEFCKKNDLNSINDFE